MLIVGVEGLPMEHGVDGVDALEVTTDENVGLQFIGEHRDDLWQAALAGPVIGERVLRTDTKDIRGAVDRVGNVGQEAGGQGDIPPGIGSDIPDDPIREVWNKGFHCIWLFLGRLGHPTTIDGIARRFSVPESVSELDCWEGGWGGLLQKIGDMGVLALSLALDAWTGVRKAWLGL